MKLYRDSRGIFPVLYSWNGKHCARPELPACATNNTRCKEV